MKIGNMEVEQGDWIYTMQLTGEMLYARVCDNKFDNGCMIYWFNEMYPDMHECGWLASASVHLFKRVPDRAQSQFVNTAHGKASEEFLKIAQKFENISEGFYNGQ